MDRLRRIVVFTLLLLTLRPLPVSAQTPTANAGADKTAKTNETVVFDGSASANAFDGLVTLSGVLTENHAIRWDYGYGGWTSQGSLFGVVAYPEAGVFTATLTVCNSTGTCVSDTVQTTVTAITCSTEVTVADTGNIATNHANLQTEINNSAGTSDKCINLPAGVVYGAITQQLDLPHRTVANYLTIRTASHASLPNGTTRVSESDAALMPKIQTTGSAVSTIGTPVTSSNPSRYYNFIGIHIRKPTPSTQVNEGSFVWLGRANETSLSQLPNHIGFDRCYFDGGDNTSDSWRAIRWQGASDSWVVNSYIEKIKGFAIETQGILWSMGERNAVTNNFIEASTENMMIGGTTVSITNHLPIYGVIRRNDFAKYIGWCSFCGAYDGTNMVIKNSFELKTGRRLVVQGNSFRIHWQEDQEYAFAFTVRGESGAVPWAEVSFVDFSYNMVNKVGRGVHWLGKDDGGASGTVNHFLFRHIIFTGITFWNSNPQTYAVRHGSTTGTDKLYIIRTSTDQNGDPGGGQGRWIEFDSSTNHTNLFIIGNVGQGYFAGAGGTGTSAINAAAPGATVIKNGLYRGTGTLPADNTSVSTLALVKYTDVTTFNLALAGDSPFLTTGLSGGRAGADVATVNTLTSGTLTGVWSGLPAVTVCKWSSSPPCISN